MRIGILADVHANIDALDSVLEDGRSCCVDRWWFLGDAVGRGPEPVETVERLRQHVSTRHWLVGNHDLYAVGAQPTDGLRALDVKVWRAHHTDLRAHRPEGGRARLWEWCRRTWTLERAAPRLIRVGPFDCWLVHGALGIGGLGDRMLNAGDVPEFSYILPWEYPKQWSIVRGQFERLQKRCPPRRKTVLIHGHTHVPYVAAKMWRVGVVRGPIRYGNPLDLNLYGSLAICPGSVGQPRDRDPEAHAAYGILDTGAVTFEFRRVPYDSERMRRGISAKYDAPSLCHMLEGAYLSNPAWNSKGWRMWARYYRRHPWGWEPIGGDEGT